LVYILQDSGFSAECLVCPSSRRDKRPLAFATLEDRDISYETWPFPTLLLFKDRIHDADALLIWEKMPNHNGKRHVADAFGTVRLIDDVEFAAVQERTKLEIEHAIMHD